MRFLLVSSKCVGRHQYICRRSRMDVHKLDAFSCGQRVGPCWKCVRITKLCETPQRAVELRYWNLQILHCLVRFVSHYCRVSMVSSSMVKPWICHPLLNSNWIGGWSCDTITLTLDKSHQSGNVSWARFENCKIVDLSSYDWKRIIPGVGVNFGCGTGLGWATAPNLHD